MNGFKNIKNFLSIAFLRLSRPEDKPKENSLLAVPSLQSGTPSLYDQVNEVFVEEIFPWPRVQHRDHIAQICKNTQKILIDSLMSLSAKESKGAVDLHLIVTKEGIKFRIYRADTTQRREAIKPIDIEAFNPADDDKLAISAIDIFSAMKERGFIFEEEEPARLAFGNLTRMINIEANRPALMPRSVIIGDNHSLNHP